MKTIKMKMITFWCRRSFQRACLLVCVYMDGYIWMIPTMKTMTTSGTTMTMTTTSTMTKMMALMLTRFMMTMMTVLLNALMTTTTAIIMMTMQ